MKREKGERDGLREREGGERKRGGEGKRFWGGMGETWWYKDSKAGRGMSRKRSRWRERMEKRENMIFLIISWFIPMILSL